MAIDLGAGDGRFVLDRAAADPQRLIVGVDANASAMADSSRRASRAGRRNACFVASDVVALPPELAGLAELVTIHFPWGSLLRAAVCADPAVTRLVHPGGTLRLLVSASARDASAGLTRVDPATVERAYRCAGFRTAVSRPATVADAVAAGSSWGKRLLRSGGSDREAWLLELKFPDSRLDQPPMLVG